jgi:methylase of polypeptide subunit release factors
VALQDLAPITALPDTVLRGFATALAAGGLSAAVLAPIVERARGLHPLLRRPVHLAELRRTAAPWASLARAFVFEDPVERSELRSSGIELEPLVDCGLLREAEGGLVSTLAMAVADGLYIHSDPLHEGGDAVMGLGPLTIPLCAAVRPTRQLGRALDLGCGAGVVALLLSRRVRSVVATDINPRAVAMTRLNARLNGIDNVDAREGHLFEPVSSERFDLVASQPPFIPDGGGSNAPRFMAGGSRGDELSLGLLEQLPDHLVEGGRGVCVIEWAHGPSHEAPATRIASLLEGAPVDVLIFEYPATEARPHVVEYAAALHPRLGPPFEAEAERRLTHLAEVGVDVLVPSFVVLRRVDDRRPRLQRCAGNAPSLANAERIDARLRAIEVLASPASLTSASLRRLPGLVIRSGGADAAQLLAELPSEAMTMPVSVEPQLAAWLERFATPKRVEHAIAEACGSDAGAAGAAVRTIAQGLMSGLFEVV